MPAVERPFVQREGEDVGGTTLAHVVKVEVRHLLVAAERQLDLDVVRTDRRVHRLADRRFEEPVEGRG